MITFAPPPDASFQTQIQAIEDARAKRNAAGQVAGTAVGAPELARMSHVHEALMNWLLAHPNKSMRQCADEFGYTQSWVSTIVHSNLFQARLKEKQDAMFGMLATGLTEKLQAGADIGVEKLVEKLETSEDPRFILSTTTLFLDKLGFGSATRVAGAGQVNNGPVQNNFYVASPADLAAARGRIHDTAPAAPPGSVASPAPPALKGPSE